MTERAQAGCSQECRNDGALPALVLVWSEALLCVRVRPMRKVIQNKSGRLASFRVGFIAGRGKLAGMRSALGTVG